MHKLQHQANMVDTHHPHTKVEVTMGTATPITICTATNATTPLNHLLVSQSAKLLGVQIQSIGSQMWKVTSSTALRSAETSTCSQLRKTNSRKNWRIWQRSYVQLLWLMLVIVLRTQPQLQVSS